MRVETRTTSANSAKSNMDRTIEKCRKAIKLHSIKQKPLRNDRKWSNPEYQLWYKQEEFNPALKDAWMLLAQAEKLGMLSEKAIKRTD